MRNLFGRLSGRTVAVVAALVLAVVATIALRDYVRSAEQEATADADLVNVLVATGSIDPGIPAVRIAGSGFAELRALPRSFVPAGALTDIAQLRVEDGQDGALGFTNRRIDANEPLSTAMFSAEPPPTDAFEVPLGQVAVSVDVEATAAVANFLDVGDRVNIMVHLEDGAVAEDGSVVEGATTRLLLQDVPILAIGRRITAGAQPNAQEQVVRDDGLLTLTVALDSIDAERLVFARFAGTLYLTLLPERVDDYTPTDSTGRNRGNLFR